VRLTFGASGQQGTASFQGAISSQLADPNSRLQRSGFCGINTEASAFRRWSMLSRSQLKTGR